MKTPISMAFFTLVAFTSHVKNLPCSGDTCRAKLWLTCIQQCKFLQTHQPGTRFRRTCICFAFGHSSAVSSRSEAITCSKHKSLSVRRHPHVAAHAPPLHSYSDYDQ